LVRDLKYVKMDTQLEIKLPTKKEFVLAHLKRYGFVTLFGNNGSQKLYGLNALSQRIRELVREDHIPIETYIPNGKSMAYYIYRGDDVNQNEVERLCGRHIPGYKMKIVNHKDSQHGSDQAR
jgi:hypothetical protein